MAVGVAIGFRSSLATDDAVWTELCEAGWAAALDSVDVAPSAAIVAIAVADTASAITVFVP